MWRLLEKRLDDAATLSGHPSKGLSQGSERGEVSSVLEMWDAGEPEVHWPPDYKGVSGGSRTEVAVGGGGNVGTGSPAAVFSPWGNTGACGGVQIPWAPDGAG